MASVMFDTETFIHEVEKRPPLFNVNLKEYADKELKMSLWCDIGKSLFPKWNTLSEEAKEEKGKELMKKWKAIRDNFVKDHRIRYKTANAEPTQKKKRYLYFDQLLFLIPYVKTGRDKRFIDMYPEENNKSDSKTLKIHQENGDTETTGNPHIKQISPSKTKLDYNTSELNSSYTRQTDSSKAKLEYTDISSKSVWTQSEEMNNDKYGNKAFLMSFLPIMDILPPHSFLEVRMKISQVFQEAISARFPSSSSSSLDLLTAETSSTS